MTEQSYQKMANDDINASISHLNVHDHLKGLTVPELREICNKDRLPFSVCILNVTGELNTGSIVRNSLLTGAEEVIILGRRRYDKRGTVGSENYINVNRVNAIQDDKITIELEKFYDVMEDKNLVPIFAELGGTSLPDVDWVKWLKEMEPNKPCLVFGNENRGVPEELINDHPYVVSIPQKGVIRSFNVSCTSAVVMYDMVTKLGWW